jgi:hypothetical protein
MGAKSKPMSKLTVAELRAESDRLAGEIAKIRKLRHMIADRIRELQVKDQEEDDGS